MSPRAPQDREASPGQIATRRAVMARDAGLRRISDVTRWLAAGVVALSGGLALIAANAFHGHSAATSSTTGGSPVGQTQTPSSTASGLAPPSQAPVQSQAAPVVVSGGS